MATKKETAKKTVKKSSNPVGRPRKKYGAETLMDSKKSFKVNNNNIVFDKYVVGPGQMGCPDFAVKTDDNR